MMNLDFEQRLMFAIPEVLSPEECRWWIDRIEASELEVAPINTYAGAAVHQDFRNNDRVMFDDQEWADKLFERIKEHLPQQIFEYWKVIGCNERFRCYRYQKGQRFKVHGDGCFERHRDERSFYTFLLYLNEGFEGGETRMLTEPPTSIVPETGLAFFFQHPILHEGSMVKSGTKYVLRTDVMYRR